MEDEVAQSWLAVDSVTERFFFFDSSGCVRMDEHSTSQFCMRIDLEDSQGFAYALRWWWNNGGKQSDHDGHTDLFGGVVGRWWENGTTMEDRLALACACASISHTTRPVI